MKLVLLVFLMSFMACNRQDDVPVQRTDHAIKIGNSEKPNATSGDKNIIGAWESLQNDSKQSFSITIQRKGDGYFFSYCSVANNGDKIDCDEDSLSPVIALRFNREFEFTDYYSGNVGIARILLKHDTLDWKIVKKPEGECYCPISALLIRK